MCAVCIEWQKFGKQLRISIVVRAYASNKPWLIGFLMDIFWAILMLRALSLAPELKYNTTNLFICSFSYEVQLIISTWNPNNLDAMGLLASNKGKPMEAIVEQKTNMHSTVPTSIDLRDIHDKSGRCSADSSLNTPFTWEPCVSFSLSDISEFGKIGVKGKGKAPRAALKGVVGLMYCSIMEHVGAAFSTKNKGNL
ncbi:hypothetical protein Tco_0318068 [Tanacetum coccineum]